MQKPLEEGFEPPRRHAWQHQYSERDRLGGPVRPLRELQRFRNPTVSAQISPHQRPGSLFALP
ncbi:hypothetical protein SEA_GAMBINO_35 [Gordonia phage Gambino]|nr:hypothetical protein SEA_GAMBINO_35 [Gordonia phage Gambino]